MDNQTLASEMLHELKASNQMWFTAFVVVSTLWLATIGVFIWYILLPAEENCKEQFIDEDADLIVEIDDDYEALAGNNL